MVVQQHVLNWLYSVLTSEYHDVNRTYNDVAQALSQYPSLSPRTDVHTFDHGVSALLLHLSGTIPVVFRGTTYRFPISIWVPHAYPREPPLGYVTPTETMVVRPGQHVDPQGRIYHPYLVRWAEFWDKSSILDFIAILRDVFAKEPPVVARQQLRPPQQQSTPSPTPPPVPPLPPNMARPSPQPTQSPHANSPRPPPPPPKGDDLPQVVSPSTARPDGPPLPPLPQKGVQQPSQYTNQPERQVAPATNRLSRYDTAPPLPPQGPQSHVQPPPNPQMQAPPQAYAQTTPNIQYHNQQRLSYSQEAAGPSSQQPLDQRRQSFVPGTAEPPSYASGPPPNWQQPVPQQPAPQPVAKPPPPPDLMDEPLTLSLPSPSNLPAPPIPPNPEKDALLRQLASTLYAMRQRARQQNESSLTGLNAQRTAMLTALQNMQNDSAALTPLSNLLASNTAVLQSSLKEADAVISNSQTHKPPAIDDLLVAPTVVGNQLYDVVAEERALGDAIFVLGRAVERGRISPAVFAKTTRGLAREWYLKKALARKIGRGMGLSG
ncbi:UEV domain-containing protein [Xylaria bambusicola]|uniref:UEV domain-containing protein n=1 Tax=Xylaria bambusicola TaxID=326684 RepID=UPI00200800DB|nr:UEV domain-containing protein [Xylaria bambusicola]KAI0528144.1 UEV domain-containing protein [Xylaria bambusicola]